MEHYVNTLKHSALVHQAMCYVTGNASEGTLQAPMDVQNQVTYASLLIRDALTLLNSIWATVSVELRHC